MNYTPVKPGARRWRRRWRRLARRLRLVARWVVAAGWLAGCVGAVTWYGIQPQTSGVATLCIAVIGVLVLVAGLGVGAGR